MSQLVWPFDGDIRLPVEIPSPAVIIISASGPVFFYKFITCSVNSSWWHWSRCCQVCVCVHHIWVWAAATARNLHLMWGWIRCRLSGLPDRGFPRFVVWLDSGNAYRLTFKNSFRDLRNLRFVLSHLLRASDNYYKVVRTEQKWTNMSIFYKK